jgi:phosphatidylglycerol:prolipoprotein diacylglycerol transferase
VHRVLFHVPLELYDIPVFGFGWLLGVWVLFSLALLGWLVWRQGLNADTWAYVPLLALGAAIIGLLLPALCDWRGFPIRTFGTLTLVAVLSATGLALWRGRRAGLQADLILSLAFWMFLPGILGARAFYVIEYWEEQYLPAYEDGLAALLGAVANVGQGGLVVYGALIGGVPGMILFVRRHRLPLLAVCDLVAPSLALALALGRIGCLMNGCCFGGTCQLPWAVTFPFNSPLHEHQVRHGETFVHGLKIFGDPHQRPVIAEVQPGSPAEAHGLKPGQQIAEVNGIPTDLIRRAHWALLGAHQLRFLIKKDDGRYAPWMVEGWPAAGKPIYRFRDGRLSILGLTLAGGGQAPPVIAEVRRGSAAALEGLKPGQQIVELSGRPTRTIDEVHALLSEHRAGPWLAISTVGGRGPVQWTIQAPLPRSRSVHPTQVYSSINAALLCLLLLAYDPFRRRDGELFLLMMSIYPITRYLLERIRVDESPVFHTPWSISQNASLLLLLGAVGLWIYVLRRPRGTAFAVKPQAGSAVS